MKSASCFRMHLPSLAVLAAVTSLVIASCGYDNSRDILSRYDLGSVRQSSEFITQGPSWNQVDLLLVVDNSAQMEPFQEQLQKSFPFWVETLDADSLHVGILSGSLGGHGSGACSGKEAPFNGDDRAHLLPTVREQMRNPGGLGFVSWKRGEDLDAAIELVVEQLGQVGVGGCEQQAPLEAMYRFLIDPEPPLSIEVDDEGLSFPVGLDEELLAQREAFLRPESKVVITLLTRQDDCSLMDGGSPEEKGAVKQAAALGHLAADPGFRFSSPSATCAQNPSDSCCYACMNEPPPDCDHQVECADTQLLPPELDRPGARCFDQKRRFGMDLRYPVSRYIEGLSHAKIRNSRTGKRAHNPLLNGTDDERRIFRDPYQIHLVAMIGLPWHDIAHYASLGAFEELAYLQSYDLLVPYNQPSGEIASAWDMVLGKPGLDARSELCLKDTGTYGCGAPDVPPLDPFMRVSVTPRVSGLKSPVVPEAMVLAPNSEQFNVINGREIDTLASDSSRYKDEGPRLDQQQLACIFRLPEPRSCAPDETACPCSDTSADPRCSIDEETSENMQLFAGAEPSHRILQVLQGLGVNVHVGSACPKNSTGDPASPYFGYNPVMTWETWVSETRPSCVSPMPEGEDGGVNCLAMEIKLPGEPEYSCALPGRSEPSEKVREWARGYLEESLYCGPGTKRACEQFQVCELRQLVGEEAEDCRNPDYRQEVELLEPGFCALDYPSTSALGWCPVGDHLVRLVGKDTPYYQTQVLMACEGPRPTAHRDIPAPPEE